MVSVAPDLPMTPIMAATNIANAVIVKWSLSRSPRQSSSPTQRERRHPRTQGNLPCIELTPNAVWSDLSFSRHETCDQHATEQREQDLTVNKAMPMATSGASRVIPPSHAIHSAKLLRESPRPDPTRVGCHRDGHRGTQVSQPW